jgi:lipid-A-disaccharide synthase
MTPKTILIVAGEPSGDANAAALVKALARLLPGTEFIGAGGPAMAAAGVKLSFNLTDDATIGPVDALKKLGTIRRRQRALADLAIARRPELIILVDFYTFNRPWVRRVRNHAGAQADDATKWTPKIAQYTSPQVWASRPGRAEKMAGDIDLLLCFFPFEQEWYARRKTSLRVECVGHPLFDRHPAISNRVQPDQDENPVIVLLPGSRIDELKRHLPVMLATAREIAAVRSARFKLVAADERIEACIRSYLAADMPEVEIQTGRVEEALSTATLAITKTGTISLECAYFGVPTLAMYKTSTLFYLVARPFVSVKYLSMPNILAGEPLFPEFIQSQATAENVSKAALALLADPARRGAIRAKLKTIIESLGGPGAAERAAAILLQLLAGR